ncbi:MAG TPA: sulfite oxidase [Solirubrobacteraceae bacterium]|nr:sulfite oxidase [Solirubrobacteraceae bacterium]
MAISQEELQLAARNHGMPLEALRWDVTPVGLHYLLIHYDIPVVDPAAWRLEVGGRVSRPLSLSLEDLCSRPAVTRAVTMECAGNGRARLEPHIVSQPWLLEAVGNAEWTGVPVAALLEEAGLADDALEILFTGLDRGVEGGEEQSYQRSLTLAEAADGALLAFAINGEPLPPQHGFPVRLIVPGWYGMTSVKWLSRIDAIAEPFAGYQQATGYRIRAHEGDEGTPVTRIMPRALMAPPGIPDFMSRARFLEAGPCEVTGRAWSGWGAIEAVDVSTDGGATWEPASLGPEPSPGAWCAWSFAWDAAPGEHELCCRARDAAGNAQPVDADWNVGGYANTSVQRVPVTVR